MVKYKPLFLHDDYDKYFFNRKEDIKKIEYQINAVKYSLPQQLLLLGVRGVGKTYLLKKIIDDCDSSIVCSYIDMQQVYSLEKDDLSIEMVLIELLNCMDASIADEDYGLSFRSKVVHLVERLKLKDYDFSDCAELFNIPIPRVDDDYKKLARFVMEFPQRVVDEVDGVEGFVIVIDEFQMLSEVDHLDKFFGLIRSFSQFQHNVSYVFTGSISSRSDVIESVNGDSGAFGGRLQQITIEPFSKEETRAYFDECMSEIRFTEDGFDRFYKCTRGIPLYINSFYNVMDSGEVYDAVLVRDAFFSNMEQILIKWVKIWSGLSSSEKEIVKVLVEDNFLSWTDLLAALSFSRNTFNKYLSGLIRKGILAYVDGKYFIEDEMLMIWLKHEKEVYGSYPL